MGRRYSGTKKYCPPDELVGLASSSGVYWESAKEEMEGRLAEERGGGGWEAEEERTFGVVEMGGVAVVAMLAKFGSADSDSSSAAFSP